jgi:chemosensory pili system protein ChpA (sensor histidine kinase/response regulator)
MSLNNDFDVGPLTWVKNEIDSALNAARDRLLEVQADPTQREPLRYAQSHVHQASGALSVVGLDGVLQFAEAIDKLLSALAANELAVSDELLALALRSVGMLGNYINEVSAGALHQPLRLFPAYQELVVARGYEAPQPSELFFPDIAARPQLTRAEAVAPERAAHELRVLRGRFEKGLLNWLRKPQDIVGAQEMLGAVRRIEQIQALPATRAFWWAAIAFFEGLATQAIQVDRTAQRMCRRIDTQMRRLLEGSQVIAERLVRDVLYFVATAHIESEHAHAVRETYGLDRILPSPDVELSDTLRQPYMLRVHETLEHAKEAWNRFCAGAAVALPQFQEHVIELSKRAEPLKLAQVTRLLDSLSEIVVWLRADPLRLTDDLSMEVATSLLVIEQANDAPNADPDQLQRQVDVLAERFHRRCLGEVLPAMDIAPFGEASQRAQERLFFNQFAREILTNLGQIEQTLDAFFRSPTQRDALLGLAGPLKQIEGAFEVLGEQSAVELVRENAAAIARFATEEGEPNPDDTSQVAHQLSALGFYVDALKTGAARLDDFLNPSVSIDEETVAAANTTVEAQLQRQARETHELVEALKDAPQDEIIRKQLMSSLESIREDAQLVADSGLEQTAKDALASLKSGGDATQGGLAEVLANVAPNVPTPVHSQEAERLLSASNEEVDAELLEIFLEEAHEVLQTVAEHRNKVLAEPHDFESLTTARRGFHTLKGSSRMVGLTEFSEVARQVEITMNRWLQLEKDANTDLVALLDNGCLTFGAWVEQLEAGGSLSFDAHELVAQAQALLVSLDSPADEIATIAAAVPVQKPQAQVEVFTSTAVQSPSTELDLTSTLMDLASVASGEQIQTEVDLAVTDFEGNTLRDFGEEFGSPFEGATSSGAEEGAEAAIELDLELDGLTAEENEGSGEVREDTSESIDISAIPVDGEFDSLDLDNGEGENEPLTKLSEVDLTSSVINAHVDSGFGEKGFTEAELDLTATDLSGLSADFEEPREEQEVSFGDLNLDLSVPNIEASSITPDSVTPVEAVGAMDPTDTAPSPSSASQPDSATVSSEGMGVAELTLNAAGPAASIPSAAAVVFTRAEETDGFEEVAIDDQEESLDSPIMDLSALSQKLPSEPAEEVADEEDNDLAEGEILIGTKPISQGLYDLYVAESRQLLDKLLEEHTRLAENSLRLPSIDAIRAAHTLAGISGTARIDPAYALGKALEHALHRFTDTEVPPEAVQTDLLGTAILTLDGMLAEVLHHVMPADVSELLAQIEALQPVHHELDAVPELAPQTIAVGVESPDISVASAEASLIPVGPVLEVPALPEAGAAPNDELDDQLLPVFFEEADELMTSLASTLRDMRSEDEAENARQALARQLHTLKGSARMAGAMRLGQYVHNLETFLDSATKAGHSGPDLVDDLENGMDQIGVIIATLKNPVVAPVAQDEVTEPEVVAEMPAPVEESGSVADEAASISETQRKKLAEEKLAEDAVFEELDAAQNQQRAPVRVRAELIDRFVNEAGEISIARTRIEGEFRVLRRSLLDLTENVIRLRNQLREVEIQAESQMQTRLAAAEAQHGDFDPLEFDRFTRLQELTRMMAESVGDVTTIQQNLLRNLDAADSALHAQGRLSRDLQQALMGVRMVPFEELADRLYRVVRQTAKELGKRANLDIIGGAIEIDRGVLDRMTAPLEHLLRNAIAHGIELPAERAAAGKAEVGQINLKLTQLSNEIALELSDDGKGLNYSRILERGKSAGLIGEREVPNENRLTQLIFEPGFSTAEKVSGIAGRGIGMDVVKNETMSVGGRISVFSDAGKGTRFVVHLPLTLAVTQALLVRCGDRTYAIPSNMVEQALELKEAALAEIRAKGAVDWKDTQYPLVYLPRLLGDLNAQPMTSRYHWVLLVRGGSQTLAVHIDELRGNQEIVVKNAGPQFVRLQGYSGATVLADGEISLILNPVALAARHTVVDLAAAKIEAEEREFADSGNGSYVEPAMTRIPSIMVVDDSLTVRKITTRLLEREGFQVVTAKDGVDALEHLVDYTPDVMLLDIEMPRMDGFDLARNVRADVRLKNIPIIMITSRMADKHRNYAMEIGVNHYLGKPYQEEQLLELITGFIAAQRS